MTSVNAVALHPTTDHPGRAIPPPDFWPSWTAPYENLLHTTRTYAGYTTKWYSQTTVRHSLSIPETVGPPCAVALAHFPTTDVPPISHIPSVNSDPDWVAWKQEQTASLCVAYEHYVAVSTPDGDHTQCPLHDTLPAKGHVSALFTPLFGLIVEKTSARTPQSVPQHTYYYLRRPLDEMTPISLPSQDHRIVYVSSDVPLAVSRNQKSITVWNIQEAEEGLPEPSVEKVESCDPISAFISNSVPDRPDEASILPRRKVLTFRKLYVSPADRFDALSVFMSHDLRGQVLLCLCISNILTGLDLGMNGDEIHDMPVAFRIRDAASAAPVLGIRRHQNALDILVRHISGSMSLLIGPDRLCAVQAQPPSKLSGFGEISQKRDNLVVSDAVGSRFSLVNEKGQGHRFSLQSISCCSPLVNDCIDAISCRFYTQGIVQQMIPLYQAILNVRARLELAETDHESRDREWEIFEHIFFSDQSLKLSSPDVLSDAMEIASQDTWSMDDSSENKDEDWNFLLNSEYHRLRGASRVLGSLLQTAHDVEMKQASSTYTKLDKNSLMHMLYAMHLLYENQKLDSLAHDSRIRLASLNVKLAAVLGFSSFIDHYKRDNHHVEGFQAPETDKLGTEDNAIEVPSVFDWLADCVTGSCNQTYPVLSPRMCSSGMFQSLCASWRSRGPAELSLQITRYYTCLYGSDAPIADMLERVESLLLEMVRDNFRRTDLDSLPFGVALPLRDALWLCRKSPSPRWSFHAFALIGREDLFNSNSFDLDSDTKARKERFLVAESRALLQIQAAAASLTEGNESWLPQKPATSSTTESSEGKDYNTANKELDGCEIDAVTCRLRFSEDKRLEEVRALLRSTDPTVMTPITTKEGDPVEIDIVAEQKKKLSILVQKRFAAPVGRGAFTLRTFVPSDPTKSLPVPSICTSGRIFAQRGTKVSFTPSDPSRVQWGEFHNGVAAGLRIVASETDSDGDTSQILTRSWIVKHRPSDMSGSATHAGMLFALGLAGYLPALRTTDYYEYLVPRHDLTSIGLMLGLATGNMGSMHDKITKMLCVHIRYFNGPGFAVPDFQVSVNVQTAAILGLGLLYQGSCEHPIVEGLFAELGHRPGPGDAVDDREGMALAAGLGIGLVCLGQGSSAFDAADRRLIDRLVIYAKGGSGDNGVSKAGRLGSTAFKNDVISRQESSSAGLADSETSRVKEGNFVNTAVVSPGALLALALIYLKTDDKQIAERIPMPETLYTLDRAKPSHVFLRLLARSLILWSDIQPSKHWVLECLPPLIRPVRGGEEENFDLLGRMMIGGTTYPYHGEDTDVRGILQARAFAIGGACTAIALKYAGTNDSNAVAVLIEGTECFEAALLAQGDSDESMEWVYMSCLSSLAMAVAVVAAGSGDLDVFRLLRRIRKRKAAALQHKRYGFHLAIHMAIGFLFMGGGCHTFGRSNVAIAGLLCAIYPQFPNDIGDNQYHLQALRHLYVLAVEPRCVETRDVDTGTPCCVDVEVRLKDGSFWQTRAPCIVPEASQVQEIVVVSERYWPTVVPINPPVRGKGWYSSTSAQVLFVKRRTGHLPYILDPKGSKGLLARSLGRRFSVENSSVSRFADVEHLFRVFSADPDILAFVKYFCNSSAASINNDNLSPKWGGQVGSYVQILYECLSTDKPEAVRSYLDAERAATAVMQGHACPSTVGSLLIAQAYINSDQRWYPPLLRPAYLARVIARALETVNYRKAQHALIEYVGSGGRMWPQKSSVEERDLRLDLSISIRLHRIPAFHKLSALGNTVIRAVAEPRQGAQAWLAFSGLETGNITSSAIEALLNANERCVPDVQI